MMGDLVTEMANERAVRIKLCLEGYRVVRSVLQNVVAADPNKERAEAAARALAIMENDVN